MKSRSGPQAGSVSPASLSAVTESVSRSVMSGSLDTMDCSPPGSSVHEILQARILGVGCHALLQGSFWTQGSNPCLLHCRQILYHLSHRGSPS